MKIPGQTKPRKINLFFSIKSEKNILLQVLRTGLNNGNFSHMLVYSMGIIAIEILTGFFYWEGPNVHVTAMDVI